MLMLGKVLSKPGLALTVLTLLFALTLSTFSNVKAFLGNVRSLAMLHHLYSVGVEHSGILYEVISDLEIGFLPLAMTSFEDSASSVSLMAVQMGLGNDYAGLDTLSRQFPEACSSRPACRFLAGKAHFRLGQDREVVYFWSHDQILWKKLIGNVAMTPNNEEELRLLERYYEILQEIEPEEASPQFMLGSIYRSRGDWNRATPFFQTALKRDPSNARYQCALGEALVITQQDIDYGLRLCAFATEQAPTDLWVYQQSARTHAQAGECEQAEWLYEYLIENFPNRLEPLVWLQDFRSGNVGLCTDNDS